MLIAPIFQLHLFLLATRSTRIRTWKTVAAERVSVEVLLSVYKGATFSPAMAKGKLNVRGIEGMGVSTATERTMYAYIAVAKV